MRLEWLGGDSTNGQSPTLYRSDRGTYVVQGWRTDQPGKIEIPHRLLQFVTRGSCFGVKLDDTGHGTFMLVGEPVTDPEALGIIDAPGHEAAVEVAVGEERRPDAPHGLR
ncbi:hypothetical protein D7D52_10310 [Nocardia yunnanensis]|uniref:Uncharacterized protein n=1 Tax=Nocardia yunnanensis TaxID=2382165 RepID=A0A386Z965_9NOCA|nr:hypothetical protein [Nocardia yunnanensis]AYF74191.1 hypothetical protein D7D52_10310 [Nocardia yunnanensis]